MDSNPRPTPYHFGLKKSFFMKLQIYQNFSYTATSGRNLGKAVIFTRLSTTNIDKRLPNSEPRIIRFQLKVEDGIKFHVRNACMCLLCFLKYIGDEKNCIFHCTNSKLIEIRKTFIAEVYETFTLYLDVNSVNDILHIMSETCVSFMFFKVYRR